MARGLSITPCGIGGLLFPLELVRLWFPPYHVVKRFDTKQDLI
jgi:hypothetical protein